MTTPSLTKPPSAAPPPTASPVLPGRRPFPVGRVVGMLVVVAITVWACLPSTGIGFDVGTIINNFSNVNRNLRALLHPAWSWWTQPLKPLLETVEMAVIATAAGGLVALPLSFLGSPMTTPSRVAVRIFRFLLSILRAIPDLLLALLFVAMIGVGALSGILALFLFTIGIIVKLTSEAIDGVDTGPMEAARSTGAGWIQADRVAILPQILPTFAGNALYVFELNIRASAVLGLVGAGGLGDTINTARSFFHYDRVSIIVLELLVVVIVLEMVSQTLRKRLSR